MKGVERVMSIFWIVVMVVCVLLEAATTALVSIWFAVGALGAFLVSLVGLGTGVQTLVFVAVSVICIVVTKPLLKKLIPGYIPTNTELDIGENAMVIEKIDRTAGTGRVRISGVDWRAVSVDGSVIDEGETVIIREKGAATLTVERIG